MSTAGDERRRAEYRKRRQKSHNSPVEKQSVDRRATDFSSFENSIQDAGAKPKPYDPIFLRDIGSYAIVQAYIDTLSQDAASASWKLSPRDENSDVDEGAIAEAERRVRNLHPELPFRDVIEQTARMTLRMGDGTWVKHYYENSDDLAEILVVDSATMFKRVDDHGITEGYVQASRRQSDVVAEFDPSEVVWFSWSLPEDRHYGEGPVEKTEDEIELLEELQQKERLDLIAGSPPGVVSPDFTDEFGTVPDEDWDTFVEGMMLDEGERHRVGYSKIPIDFTQLNSSYQELQILERSKYWVTVLGSVFKVNPSYAGFDFENTNRATDESQQEAYAQRGFRVLLRQLEEAINHGLIWEDISENIRFDFEREQTIDEKKSRAELIETQANAASTMSGVLAAGDDAGDEDPAVHFRDGQIFVDDGVIEPADDGGGDMGGFFASLDKSVPPSDDLVAKNIPQEAIDEIGEDAFVPPKGMYDAVQTGLEAIEEHGRDEASGGTADAITRARQIVRHYEDDEPLTGTNDDGVPYVREINAFFARHRAQGNHEFDDDEYDQHYEDPGWLADKLWGGDAGASWSEDLVERIESIVSSSADTPVGKVEADDLVFDTEAEAERVAELLGIEGSHTHDDGETYMPGPSHDVLEDAVEAATGGDSGNSNNADVDDDDRDTLVLSDDQLAEYDRHILEAHKTQIQPESVDDIEKRAWERDEDVPEYVLEGIRNAIDRGAIFENFETVPGTLRETLEDVLRDSLTQPNGWSLDSIVDRLADAFPGVDTDSLETVARTETTSILNRSREVGYENREDADEFRYYWNGPGDTRTTDLCEDLKIATGQASGTPETDFSEVPGGPVDMSTLVRLEREASEEHFPDLQFRRHVPHINCRHTFVRDASADIDVDVDVPDAEVFNSVAKCGCTDAHDAEYASVVKDMVSDFRRSNREHEVEAALGEPMPQILRRAFVSSGGSVEPAKRQINDRLRESPSYDHEAKGLVSKPTLYSWKDRYEEDLTDVV